MVHQLLEGHGIEPLKVSSRAFDDEFIVRIEVAERVFSEALKLQPSIEAELVERFGSNFLVNVRKSAKPVVVRGQLKSLEDPRVDLLLDLINSRSRASRTSPSLSYIKNNESNLTSIKSARHNLVFGRRGAGKTTLLLEAQKWCEAEGLLSVWVNCQPLQHAGTSGVFLAVVQEILGRLQEAAELSDIRLGRAGDEIASLLASISELDPRTDVDAWARAIVPQINQMLQRALLTADTSLYVFLDDFYFVPRHQQPEVIDLLHSATRECNTWIKIASIRHLSRWFIPEPPTGWQTGDDADLIDLDLTLQNAAETTEFLQEVLRSYCQAAGIAHPTQVIVPQAVYRLVFASGGVPRDFLTLFAGSIARGRRRKDGRTVGVSDVNQAAGDGARTKLGELETELSANVGYAQQTHGALQIVRRFCLFDKGFSYFRIGLLDKDQMPDAYNVVMRLLDARLIHLIDASLSDGRQAGVRSEVFTLDLSQYSSDRLKQGIRVLDLENGALVSKQTRSSRADGTSARKYSGESELIPMLRIAPQISLKEFEGLALLGNPAATVLREKILSLTRPMALSEIVAASGRTYTEIQAALRMLESQGKVLRKHESGETLYLKTMAD